MKTLIESILKRHDNGEHVAVIATAENVSIGYVYGVLRKHRPDRQRKPRERTSERRRFILGLLAQDIRPRRVAFLAQVTPAYVYGLMKQEGSVPALSSQEAKAP
jgi:hypothetical protein